MQRYRAWQADWAEYINCSEELLDKNLGKLTDEELIRDFKEFYQLYLGAGAAAYLADSFMSTGETDWLEEMFREALAEMEVTGDRDEILRILLSPGFLSFTIEEEFDLLGLAVKFSEHYGSKLPDRKVLEKESPKLYKSLQKHRQKYYWMANNYYQAEIISLADFYDRLKQLVSEGKNLADRYQKKQREIKDYEEKRQQVLANLPLDEFHRNVLQISDLFTEWKDVRKSGVYVGMSHFEKFLAEIGGRAGITTKDMTFLVFEEVCEVLSGDRDLLKKIAARKDQIFYAVTPAGYYVVAGTAANKYFVHLEQQQSEDVKELRGVGASLGKATGIVRVIKSKADMIKFQVGEILVANQTTPDFVPVMKKAAAIVTEQGGITSHAAVVSRELKIPCIIGTKIATKAFQTGDRVEVDASKGIAKKI
ncbi:MAG: hypothetical protein HQ530_05485 [Parcubacteria group bacterium]|nr:hypothetical protein [Parcubacteria group bacterium]